MTCIVGLIDEGKVYLGGDSAGISDWDLIIRADSKVFQNGPFLMGFTTSFRMGQLLRYALVPPYHEPGTGTLRFLATAFVSAVRDCLKAGGYASRQNERESGGDFLVGYRGGLYRICSDYQVEASVDPWAAVGCGAPYTLGALYATQGQPARERLMQALLAAEHFSAGVRGPFLIEELAE